MPKLVRKGQRILHQCSVARQQAASGPSVQPLFRRGPSATPGPDLQQSNAEPVLVSESDSESDADIQLPSDKRRKTASKNASSAIAQVALRNQVPATSSNAIVGQADDDDEDGFEHVDILPSTPSLTQIVGSSSSKVTVKPDPEIIEIKSDDDDDDDFQILNSPPAAVAQPPRTPSPPLANQESRGQRPFPPHPTLLGMRRPPRTGVGTKRKPKKLPVAPGKSVLVRDKPWPDHFDRLEQTFKAVNTVYSFCSARKHMATTYDTIKSGVEGLIKRPLQVFDMAQIKSLCPDLVHFAYVEQDMLQVHMDARANGGEQPPPSRAKRAAAIRDEVYAQTAAAINQSTSEPVDGAGFATSGGGFQDVAALTHPGTPSATAAPDGPLLPLADLEIARLKGKQKAQDEYVLLFEFNDGTLNGPKATSRGAQRPGPRRAPTASTAEEQFRKRFKRNPKLNSIPSTGSMMKLINKRNFKFEQAVLELMAACEAKEEDPVQLLIDAAHDHVPLNPETAERTETETPKKKRIRLEFLMQNPEHRPEVSEVIEEMKIQPWWKDQIVPGGHKIFDARKPRYAQLHYQLSQAVVNSIYATRGIEQFYTHQAEALNALHAGQNVIVSTSTSSGKSLIYQLPVLQALEQDSNTTAMYIFPTKALAQDQRRSLQDLLANCEGLEDVIVATYDGDTDHELRRDIRERASVIFTNPDMLHQSILPSEDLWRRFLRNLRFVVVDELHIYNGLFGAHVSLIMRRLRRICHALGNDSIRFVSCSATVANPREHMQTLFGIQDVHLVTDDGSPAGRKEWLVWNPPLIDEADPAQGRVSAYAEVSKVFRHLIQRGVRTIVFTKVRRTCEIVMRQVRDDLLLEDRADVAKKVMSYRSGYSPQDRRKIEQDMFRGQLLGIVATSALELGIDIGSLDAVIMLGFPYSISSLRQQAGRAGRRQKDSLAVLIGDPWPLDQHYMNFPEQIFIQPDSALSVDLDNDFILESHLQCAAEEMPISVEDDVRFFGERVATLCKTRLEGDGSGYFYCREELRPNPARGVAIRGARQTAYSYVDDTPGRAARVMEEVEMDRAIFEAYDGAVFMHQGRSYICREISHDTRIARMVEADVNYHTRPRDHTDTDAVETYRIRRLRESACLAYYGRVTITSHVWGYFKVDRRANILDAVEVDCPPFVRHTRGLWLDVPGWIVGSLTEHGVNAAAAIHAAEHALLSLTPMFVISAAGDVRTECKIAEKEYASRASRRKRPARLIFYDTNGGVCAKAFEHLDGLIRIAVSVIEHCACREGCPACVTSHTCAHANLVTSKVGALAVLRGIIGREPFDADTGRQNEPGAAMGELEASESLSHTIQEATPVPASQDVVVEDVHEPLPPALGLTQPQPQPPLQRPGGFVHGKSMLFQE